MTPTVVVGVLALQGAFHEHLILLEQASSFASIQALNVSWAFTEVRTSAELQGCDALIIPGGESTTMALVASRSNLMEPLRHFVKSVSLPNFVLLRHIHDGLTDRTNPIGRNVDPHGAPAQA